MGAIKRGVRNTFRNATRSVGIIVILAVAISLSISMLSGRSAVNNRIAQVQGHTADTLTVSPTGSFGPFSNGSTLSAADVTKINGLADVSDTVSSFTANLTSGTNTSLSPTASTSSGSGGGGGFGGGGFGGNSERVIVLGTQNPGSAVNNETFGGSTETLTSGTTFSATSTADVAILGSSVASTNSLTVGSTFTAWNTTIKVVGIYSAGTRAFANDDVLMPLATVQKLSGSTGDATSVTVYVTNSSDLSAVQTAIEGALGTSANVLNGNAATLQDLSTLSSTKSTMNYLLWGTVAAAALILVLSMLMIVRERRREIGVLKAIGASNRSVISQFIAEASTFTVIGSVVGFVLGLVLASPLTNQIYGGNPSTGPGGFAGRGGSGGGRGPGLGSFGGGRGISGAVHNLSVSTGWSTLLFAFLIAVVVAVVGSTVSAATTLRIRPADVLRSE